MLKPEAFEWDGPIWGDVEASLDHLTIPPRVHKVLQGVRLYGESLLTFAPHVANNPTLRHRMNRGFGVDYAMLREVTGARFFSPEGYRVEKQQISTSDVFLDHRHGMMLNGLGTITYYGPFARPIASRPLDASVTNPNEVRELTTQLRALGVLALSKSYVAVMPEELKQRMVGRPGTVTCLQRWAADPHPLDLTDEKDQALAFRIGEHPHLKDAIYAACTEHMRVPYLTFQPRG